MERMQSESGSFQQFDWIPEAYAALDTDLRYIYVNAAAAGMFGCTPEDLVGCLAQDRFDDGSGPPFDAVYRRALADQQPATVEAFYPGHDRWFRSHVYPSPDRLTLHFVDITQRKRAVIMDAGQRAILADIAAHRPLAQSLEAIARLYEQLNPEALCSVLLTDADGTHLAPGAGPSLPAAFNAALEGLEIGDARGSCGTALSRGERVIVADIEHHPYWAHYRELALAYGLRACWSSPVLSISGSALGTFAVYYRKSREPRPEELDSVDRLLSLTVVAIESHRHGRRLRERELFFDLSSEVFCIFGARSERVVQANATLSRLTGFDEHELTSRHFLAFVHPDDHALVMGALATLAPGKHAAVVYRFLCKDGGSLWLSWDSVMEPDGMVFAVGHDISGQRQTEAALVHAASHDAVTALPHHLGLASAVSALLADPATPTWVLFINIDRFKAINESMGHDVGDKVLQCVARRLDATVGSRGHIARFGGDTFVVALASSSHHEVLELARQLRESVAAPIETSGYRLLPTASIGISHSPDHGHTSTELLRRAEAAMGRAKRSGRDMVCEFAAEQMHEIEDRLLLGSLLRGAFGRDEMCLHYQPQHNALSGGLTGFEALLRWTNPTLGDIPPGRFIPVAEALGLMPEIGAWVVNEACSQARAWLDQGHRDFQMAVNISPQELQRPGLLGYVRAALERHGVPRGMLCVELTESSLMENVARAGAALLELKSLGVKLSLDDFGTGYSSLAYLKRFPIDKLKIDQAFVRGLPQDNDDAAIARTIVDIGHQLHMEVTAEGVETRAQALFLDGIGCDELQGYYLGRPVAPVGLDGTFGTTAKSW